MYFNYIARLPNQAGLTPHTPILSLTHWRKKEIATAGVHE